jgi:hypothetical protein
MLRVRMLRVPHDRVEELRTWFRELAARRSEVLETFAQEGTRAEAVHLLSGGDGPVLVYVMDVDDAEKAQRAFASSTLPIDAEHKRVMKACCEGSAEAEVLFECSRI